MNEWMILMSGALVGLGARSLEVGVEYVKERKAFGVPIGSFQAVSHGLADAATALDGATLLAREAAWSAEVQPERTPELGPLAFGFCTEAAREASYRSLHYHGGYGFMLEYDIQLYFRRARGWPAQFAEPDVAFGMAAARRLSARTVRRLSDGGGLTMDFRLGEKSEKVRLEARAFLAEALTPEVRRTMEETGVHHSWDFHRKLVERGWLAPGWPKEFGGQGRDPLEILAFAEELQRAGAPTYGVGTTLMIAGVIRHIGTEEQKKLILPPALRGELIIVLGFTEPESGSDVAAAQTRAVRDGDQWIINGQKMFTTNAQEADYAFMLTRTNTEVPKHQGLTTFLVPLKQPGVEIRAVRTISGERTNLTFYTDVRVDDSLRVGAVDGGWDTMAVGLTLERAGPHGGQSFRLLGRHGALGRHAARPPARGRRERPAARRGSDRVGPPGPGGRRERGGQPPGAPQRLDPVHRRAARRGGVDGQALRLRGAHPAGGRLHGHARPRRRAEPGRPHGGRGRRGRVRPAIRPGRHHLRRHQRDPAQHHRPARAGASASTLSR